MKRSRSTIICLLLLCLLALVSPASAAKRADLDTPDIAGFSPGDVPFTGEFQVVAFNLEYGAHLGEEMAYLSEMVKKNPATIFLLSECDQYHSRSRDKYVARDIAQALRMNMIYVIEYVEFNDKTKDTPATTGNAILSPFPLTDVSVIRHREAFSWEAWGWIYGQPRRGGVVALGATVNFPDGRRARVYSLHLESNTIHPLRAMQLWDVLPEADKFKMPLILGGDLNSIPHTATLRAAKKISLQNVFAHDYTPTGWCFFPDDSLHCVVKIDWILFRGLDLVSRDITTLMTADRHRVSDHAAVSAVFSMK
jgi:endonuclease/exonuclease/phosphatase family metal-dependent hydrolase